MWRKIWQTFRKIFGNRTRFGKIYLFWQKKKERNLPSDNTCFIKKDLKKNQQKTKHKNSVDFSLFPKKERPSVFFLHKFQLSGFYKAMNGLKKIATKIC